MATHSLELETSFQIGTAESRAVADIDRALRKLDQGTYGVCEECGKRIPRHRLRVLPFAALCRQCQEAAERAGDHGEKTHPRSLRPWDDASFGDEDAAGAITARVRGSTRLSS